MYLLPRAIHHTHGGDHSPDTGSHPVGDTNSATTNTTSSTSTTAYSSSSSWSSYTSSSTRTYGVPYNPASTTVRYRTSYSSSQPSSLNAGEIIGIVVGVLAGIVLLIVVVAWLRHSQKGPLKAKAVPPPFSGPRARMAAAQSVPMTNIAGPASPARAIAARPTSPFLDPDPADLEPPPPPYAPDTAAGADARANTSAQASEGAQARDAAEGSIEQQGVHASR